MLKYNKMILLANRNGGSFLKKKNNSSVSKNIVLAASLTAAVASLAAFAYMFHKKTKTFEVKAVKRTVQA